jgi:hypothetical protein
VVSYLTTRRCSEPLLHALAVIYLHSVERTVAHIVFLDVGDANDGPKEV